MLIIASRIASLIGFTVGVAIIVYCFSLKNNWPKTDDVLDKKMIEFLYNRAEMDFGFLIPFTCIILILISILLWCRSSVKK